MAMQAVRLPSQQEAAAQQGDRATASTQSESGPHRSIRGWRGAHMEQRAVLVFAVQRAEGKAKTRANAAVLIVDIRHKRREKVLMGQ
jgi:hypothetical protein